MDNLILEAKITAPTLPEWVVPRDRITKRLAGGSRCPLTVVTGPPGAGKTMALALWAESAAAPDAVAWISLDHYDNRPRVFWSYVLAATAACRNVDAKGTVGHGARVRDRA